MTQIEYGTPKEKTYFRKEFIDLDTGEKFYQTRENLKNGWYKITTRYSDNHIETEYEKGKVQ